MASTIKIKNSSTAGAIPTSSDLVQGELAVNVTDKTIFTENASGTVVELGKNYTGFKNRLINAQGLINQRAYASGAATSGANQYTLDRWRVVTSGQNLTFSTTANEVTFTAPAGGVEQVIEGLNLESATYVLSWTGTATATVAGSSVANGGTVSVTGGTNTTVRFSGGTFKNPQFEKGSTATSFDYRPYGTELVLCQRYYQQSSTWFCYAVSTSAVRASFPLVASMRSTPTPTVATTSGAISNPAGTNGTPSGISVVSFDSTNLSLAVNSSVTMAGALAGYTLASLGGALITLSSEL